MKLPQPKYTVTDVKHKYSIALPSGETVGPLVSVTKVLEVIAKPALISWAARESAAFFKGEIMRIGRRALDVAMLEQIAKDAAQAHRRKAKAAANIGTACHAACEDIIHGRETARLIPEIVQPVNAFKKYRLQSDIEIVATELAVASVRHRFGGRLDFLGYSKSRGGWGLGDIKTSSGYFGVEYALQVGGGYATAVEEMYGIEIAWAEIIRISKKPPFESEARPITDIRASIAGFLTALELTHVNRLPLIGDPLFTSVEQTPAPVSLKKKRTPPPLGF